MTLTTFWSIFLKILGLCCLLPILSLLPELVFILKNNSAQFGATDVISMLLMNLTLYLVAVFLFLFKTSWIIRALRLDVDNAQNKIDFNLQADVLLRISIIVIGGITIVEAFPQLISQTLTNIEMRRSLTESKLTNGITVQFIKIIFGLVLLTNSKGIARFFVKGDKSLDLQNSNI